MSSPYCHAVFQACVLRFFFSLLGALVFCLQCSLQADVRIPSILGDHMVLQQKSMIRWWGWADPAESITVTSSWGDRVEGVADSGGRWELKMMTPAAGGPHEIVIGGRNEHRLRDVMVGEVWLCSGQSNMEWGGRQQLPQALEEAPSAHHPLIRFFETPKATAHYPQDATVGNWNLCDPQTMAQFSAIGYFYGLKLQEELKVPVGLIGSYWGGTPAEVWTPASVVNSSSSLTQAAKQLQSFAWWPKDPGLCYNAMIHPLTPYNIAGVIWYQGESNVQTASSYRQLFGFMINAWRDAWDISFPFYYVQIAPFAYEQPLVGPRLREMQTQALEDAPSLGMVVISDLVDDIKDIHPVRKKEVAQRLAAMALNKHYALEDADPFQSPMYAGHVISGKEVRVHFDHATGGLISQGGDPVGFELAGKDRVFHAAKARVDGSDVVLHTPLVPEPVAVRFGFHNQAMPNLFSTQGLPVNLFRSDSW